MSFLSRDTKKNQSSQIPLKWILVIPFVLQVAFSVEIVSYLSYRSGKSSIENISQDLMIEMGEEIEEYLDNYLETAQKVNQLNKQVLENGIIDRSDFEKLGKYFWQQIQQYNFTHINYGTPKNEFIGVGYFKNRLQISQIKSSHKKNPYSYQIDKKGHPIHPPTILSNQTPNDADWYHKAQQARKPIWSEIYTWADNPQEISISASAPVYSESQEFLGVVGIDLSLSHISQFLQTLNIGETGQIFIIEKSGLLVATSTQSKPHKIVEGKATRIPLTEISDNLSQKTVNILQSRLANFPQGIKTDNQFIQDSGLFIQVIPYRDDYGIDWLMLITIPQSDFMTEIQTNRQRLFFVSTIILLTSTIMGIITTKWITKPIIKISQASKAIIHGEVKTYFPETTTIAEINTLSNYFSMMANQLQEALSQSENRYRHIVEQQTDFIIRSNPDTTITFVNEALCVALGCQPEEIIGKKWLDFTTTEDLETTLVKITQLTPENPDFTRENRDNRSNGEKSWTQWINQGIFNENGQLIEIQSVGRDITEQKIAELALKKSEARFQQIALSSPGVIYILLSDSEAIELIIEIQDSGVGIENDQITQLFQPFTQADTTISRKYGGTGLGLAICKNLVNLMGGTIWVESKGKIGGNPPPNWTLKSHQEQGSTFYFTLKVTPVAKDILAPQKALPPTSVVDTVEKRNLKILLAEDNKVNQKVALLTLKKLGYTADVANNGLEVLDLLEIQPYDVIFMDMQMPEMDGVTATQIIRQSSLPQPYIIALTANALDHDREICLLAGMNDFITKPIKVQEIDRVLQTVNKI